MAELEQTLSSVEIADMIEKSHSKLIRDIRRYTDQFNEAKIGFVDFFKESTYKDAKGEIRPCYRITKKGCEFIAHKLTGTKGTIFTARYINRFHEMEDILSQKASEPELPWFIRRFRGKYIMLFRDFETVTGVSLQHDKPFWKSHHEVMNRKPPLCWNGWATHATVNKEEFKKEYGFDYGDDKCMYYLYPYGIRKALELCRQDRNFKIDPKAYDMIMSSLMAIEKPKKEIAVVKSNKVASSLPIQISIIVENEQGAVKTSHVITNN